jgi:hypothetical protein
MEQPSNRSDQVVTNYRQHKMSASVYARIKELLMKFEADSAADRRMAWIGLGIALALVASVAYFFVSGSQITIS